MMKYSSGIVALIALGLIIYGFIILEGNEVVAHKCIGFGTVGIFFIAMPLFLIRVSKGKNVKNYMLNEENIRKMQGKNLEKTENQ
ncbi:MAG: hypothetical protein ABJD66_14830 [Cellulophaga sp.]|uniref:hypothetical protein n=1 Tax=unclassified Cellulophaga TaxID=2634405 RepID=UPI000CAD29BE|nr:MULTISPECIES: hypothetical protein [unclassified Cellulophaga]MDO6490033.1 hypothetical protein [Cellulophaga sp. 2_MG-2023]MDO6494773.1 hypothetical protein [Cellulophaga sp. 3_MG-2023]PKB42335.1 hypothetical protein AX016_0499 [Cellulophaga sp. RHA19]